MHFGSAVKIVLPWALGATCFVKCSPSLNKFFVPRHIRTLTMTVKRVCVIGAGAAGLVAIRHIKEDPSLDGCVFEQNESIGGVWDYTDKTGINQYGIPIHSTAYHGLRTNLPKEVMGFLDYPFSDESNYSYVSHREVLRYLEKFANHHQLSELIHFTTRVTSIEPTDHSNDTTSGVSWRVKTENLKTKNISDHLFDAVIVCNGYSINIFTKHYTQPYIPHIKDLSNFKGEICHSRDYRKPDPFAGKRVIVLGGGPSAIDISIELAQVASQVMLSCRNASYSMPQNISMHSPVVAAKSNSFLTTTGQEVECDTILLCSGYMYDFPFLKENCGVSVEKGKYIYPLYHHLINANMPSMAFIGIPFTVCPFPQFDIQVRYFLKTVTGQLQLPSKDQMVREIRKEEETRRERCIPFNHSHKFGDAQWAYNKLLAEEAGFSELIRPVIEKAYDRAGERRQTNPADYKHDFVRIIDNDNFEYIEDFYTKS